MSELIKLLATFTVTPIAQPPRLKMDRTGGKITDQVVPLVLITKRHNAIDS